MMDVIFDIDGTLANPVLRLPFIKDPALFVNGKPDWDGFFDPHLMSRDEYICATWDIMQGLIEVHDARPIFVTGRPERTRFATCEWLYDCPAISPDLNHVFMRADGDRRPSAEVKRDALGSLRLAGYNPVMAFEDRAADAAMWRAEGLTCFQVAEGAY